MRRLLLAGTIAATAAALTVSSAAAWCTYCDWDPTVLIVTPGGHIVPVYASVWTSSLLDIGLPLESYKATRAYDANGQPVTAVDMAISVPTGKLFSFQVTDEVTTGLLGGGQLLARQSGWSGQTLHLKFVLPES